MILIQENFCNGYNKMHIIITHMFPFRICLEARQIGLLGHVYVLFYFPIYNLSAYSIENDTLATLWHWEMAIVLLNSNRFFGGM